MQKFILFLLTLLCLVQLSCKKNEKPSFLIIAVDELTMTDITCNEDDKTHSGLQILCNESVRFTHAFTPSTLTVPALASLLTGLYPFQHNVRHNGGPRLAAEIELASEVAIKKGYRTSFFSGGAPVFRRSGLNQGFEVFDDNLVPTFSAIFRNFKKNVDIFTTWLTQDVDSDPFFSVLYVPDLLFINTETSTNLGEIRNLSLDSQIDEFDETLFDLVKKLKAINRWDNTTVVLVGLNGHTSNPDSRKEIPPNNLNGENTQVALLIKPAQTKKRDEAIYWKIDQNVTLVDVGRTLFETLGVSTADQTTASFPANSLADLLKTPQTTANDTRPILIESGWAFWRKSGPIRIGVIAGYVLYINDEKPLLYNTLIDRFESTPLPLLQESTLPTTQKIQALIEKNEFTQFIYNNKELAKKLSIPYHRWMRLDKENVLLQDLKRLARSNPESMDIANWTAQIALNQKDWETLRQLGEKHNNNLWQLVGERNLNIKDRVQGDDCINLLVKNNLDTESLKKCSDPLFLDLVDWLRAEDRGLAKDLQRKRFERSFRTYMLDQYIQRSNIAAGLIWDTSPDNIFAPSRTEIALHLPEYVKARNQIYKSLQTEE